MHKILSVDDDPTIRKLISETLTRAGYEVESAKDGIDAMVHLKQQRPDLVLLDVMMPEVNGYDVCYSIKRDPALKDIPIIIMTTREQEIDPGIGALMGVDYLHKSCSPKDLLAKVSQILGRKIKPSVN